MDIDNQLKLGLKASHGASRKYRYSLRPDSSSSFNMGDVIRFSIPTRKQNTFLVNQNCYFKCDVLATAAATSGTVRFDGSAASLIRKMDEYSSGNLLSSLDNYNALFDVLFARGVPTASESSYSIWMGTSETVDPNSIGQGAELTLGTPRTVCVPILSPCMGNLSELNCPVYAIDDLRLEITLASVMNAFARTGQDTVTISNVSLELEFLELSEDAMRMAIQYNGKDGSISYNSSAFRAYVNSLPADAAGTQTMLINSKFSSLKTVYSMFLDRDGSSAGYSTTSRPKYIQKYQLKVGANQIPQKPIDSLAEFFLYGQMARHSGPGSLVSKGSTNLTKFGRVDPTITGGVTAATNAASSHLNDFYVAVSTDSVAGSSDVMMSGINTIGENVFVEVEMNTGAKPALQVASFAEYDCIFVIRDGLVSVKF
jgi:hypothetical protein